MSPPVANRLLIIDDDAELNALLAEYLARFGHRLAAATTAAEGRRALEAGGVDLLILDLMLPDRDGLSLCREIRADFDVPIVMLSARGDVADRVVGLELGADDYLPKPFEPRELAARIESVLRRARGRDGSRGKVLACRGLSLDVETRRVVLDGGEIELTTMELELLQALMTSRGRVLSRDRLVEQLRGLEADVYDRSIDMLISRLRHKLGDDPRSPRFIKTVWRTGYQFVGAGTGEDGA